MIGDKWQGHNVWFFTKQRQNLEADAVVSVVSAVPVRVNADGVLIDARSGVEVPSWMTGSTLGTITDSQPTPENEFLGQEVNVTLKGTLLHSTCTMGVWGGIAAAGCGAEPRKENLSVLGDKNAICKSKIALSGGQLKSKKTTTCTSELQSGIHVGS